MKLSQNFARKCLRKESELRLISTKTENIVDPFDQFIPGGLVDPSKVL
jgi:hypothetical protein